MANNTAVTSDRPERLLLRDTEGATNKNGRTIAVDLAARPLGLICHGN